MLVGLLLTVGLLDGVLATEAVAGCRPGSRRACRRARIAKRSARRVAPAPRPCNDLADVEAKPQSLFDGRTLAGWRVADEADFTAHGEVKVVDGQIELGIGSPASGIVRTAEGPRINYEVSLEAKRTGGGDFFCGLTFPVREQHCTLIVGGWGGGVVGLSNIDGVSAADNAVATFLDVEDDRWYRIRLRVTEQEIKVWIDDEQMIEVVTDEHNYDIWWEQEPMRPLGIATWYTSAALRNIKLEEVSLTKTE